VKRALLFPILLFCACGDETGSPPDSEPATADAGGGADTGIDAGFALPDAAEDGGIASADAAADGGTCAEGSRACPIQIVGFPFTDDRDTRSAPSDAIDAYSCAASTDESGGEFFYAFTLTAPARITATVDDSPGDEVDVDLHVSSSTDAASCFDRGNVTVAVELDPGSYLIVADTWVDDTGRVLAGPYHLEVRAESLTAGSCATQSVDLKMFWTSCAAGIDCYEAQDPGDGQTYRYLRTPSSGPVVREAHLVTVAETFPNDWPTSFTDQIQRHYQISEAATGYAMQRNEPWAPAGEGGSMFGQGAIGSKLPVVDEAWYINMYWRNRPAPGTRMIVRNTTNGRAVVAAAGYETGPGSNTAIGGVTEEIHHYLGTTHRSTLEVGFAADTTLPLGPIRCQ
jgi:hypothetical protein